MSDKGRQALWNWFGLSRASWLTMPRILMHDMPDEWQEKMASLLEEYDETYPNTFDMPDTYVTAKKGGRFAKLPAWIGNYRYPDKDAIQRLKEWGDE